MRHCEEKSANNAEKDEQVKHHGDGESSIDNFNCGRNF
jgi:hypothetical protein